MLSATISLELSAVNVKMDTSLALMDGLALVSSSVCLQVGMVRAVLLLKLHLQLHDATSSTFLLYLCSRDLLSQLKTAYQLFNKLKTLVLLPSSSSSSS